MIVMLENEKDPDSADMSDEGELKAADAPAETSDGTWIQMRKSPTHLHVTPHPPVQLSPTNLTNRSVFIQIIKSNLISLNISHFRAITTGKSLETWCWRPEINRVMN